MHTCAYFCYKIAHCENFVWCIVRRILWWTGNDWCHKLWIARRRVNDHGSIVVVRWHFIHRPLTQWGRDKMAAIFQTTFSNSFTWMKMHEFQIRFYWRLSQGSNWQNSSIGWDNGLAPNRRQAIIWTSDGRGYWRIYASLGLNELTHDWFYRYETLQKCGIQGSFTIPYAVSLVLRPCDRPMNVLYVREHDVTGDDYVNLTVCMTPLLGNSAFIRERLIEISRVFGAQRFISYNIATPPQAPAMDVIEYYCKMGVIGRTHYMMSRCWMGNK